MWNLLAKNIDQVVIAKSNILNSELKSTIWIGFSVKKIPIYLFESPAPEQISCEEFWFFGAILLFLV